MCHMPTPHAPRLAQVRLNGQPLLAAADGSLPSLEGEPHSGRHVVIPPLSVAFFVFPEAHNAICFPAPQSSDQRHGDSAASTRSTWGATQQSTRKRERVRHGSVKHGRSQSQSPLTQHRVS